MTPICFVRLYKLYMNLRPADRPADSSYLMPLQNPSDTCWYSSRPLGYHKLGTTVAHLYKSAGIPGYKTNHSLRVTAATRLYDSGIDEQLVMETTGHCSTEVLTKGHLKQVSDILSAKRICVQHPNNLNPLNLFQSRAKLLLLNSQTPHLQPSRHHLLSIHAHLSPSILTPVPSYLYTYMFYLYTCMFSVM